MGWVGTPGGGQTVGGAASSQVITPEITQGLDGMIFLSGFFVF
jgi:hypothetical protein